MNFKEIQELIKLIDKSNLAEFRMKNQEIELLIRSQKYYKNAGQTVYASNMQSSPSIMISDAPASTSQPQAVSVTETPKNDTLATAAGKVIEVKSPMVGTFYRSAGPGKGPFVSVGDSIEKGSVVCVIEAMKLFNEIESEVGGKILKVMVEDASPVEYDQVLFLVEP